MSSSRKMSYSAGSWALLIAVVGIIFVVNYLADKAFSRVDMTENRIYTLSDSTVNMLKDLDDVVTIQVVISSNIPNPWNIEARKAKDLVEEYRIHSEGNIEVKKIDPIGDTEIQEELRGMGMSPIQLPIQGTDQASVVNVWAYIHVQYRDNSELVASVLRPGSLEYDLTNAIARVLQEEKTRVGFLNAEGREIMREFGTLKSLLENQFEVVEVDTSTGEGIPGDVDILYVLNPNRPTERDLYEIDQFIMRGGRAIILSAGANIFLQPGQFGTPVPVYAMAKNPQMDPLGPMLAHYGVKRNYDLVQDKPSAIYPLFGPLGPKYPLWPQISLEEEYQAEHPITDGLGHITFAWNSSLEAVGDTTGDVTMTKLIVTSPKSWAQGGQQLFVDPNKEPLPPLPVPGMGEEQRTMAYLLSGSFESYFAGQEAPPALMGDTVMDEEEPDRRDKSEETHILVIGGHYFIWDGTPIDREDLAQNMGMMLSATEWMSGGYMLSDIKKKDVETRPIEVTSGEALLIGLVAPLAAPVLVIAFGVFRFQMRKRKKTKFLENLEK